MSCQAACLSAPDGKVAKIVISVFALMVSACSGTRPVDCSFVANHAKTLVEAHNSGLPLDDAIAADERLTTPGIYRGTGTSPEFDESLAREVYGTPLGSDPAQVGWKTYGACLCGGGRIGDLPVLYLGRDWRDAAVYGPSHVAGPCS